MNFMTAFLAQASPYTGRIQGGWEYVWASYFIAWAGLSMYGFRLASRRDLARSGWWAGLVWVTLALGVGGILHTSHSPVGYQVVPVALIAVGLLSMARTFKKKGQNP